MIKIKKDGFTLSEVLVTLAVVGTLAILVLPGLIKDTNNKAMMSNLQSAVSTLNNAVQNELISKGTQSVENTDIKSDPEAFLQTLDVAKLSKTDTFADKYTTLNGGNGGKPNVSYAALLKNGIAVGLSNTTNNDSAKAYTTVYVDTNGPNTPNIIGVDLFALKISWGTSIPADANSQPQHSGDLGAFPNGTINYSTTEPNIGTVKTNCKAGNPAACYLLVERTSFDPNYIENAE